jgi:nitrogen regulatory protein P-II 1
MKKVEAIVQPFVLDEVRDALIESGLQGMTITEVRGVDPHPHAGWYRGTEYITWFTPRIKIEVVVAEEDVDRCVAAISRNARVGDTDGEIVVLPVDVMIRIRTGERLVRVARAA